MDVLIVIGVVLVVVFLVVQMFQYYYYVYFEFVVMLFFFFFVGCYFDYNMCGCMCFFVENIVVFKVEVVVWINLDGIVWEVFLLKIVFGDCVFVVGGDWVFVDGVVEIGILEIDQSFVIGESVLVFIKLGQRVYVGILNGVGVFQVWVEVVFGVMLFDEVNWFLEIVF